MLVVDKSKLELFNSYVMFAFSDEENDLQVIMVNGYRSLGGRRATIPGSAFQSLHPHLLGGISESI